MTAQVLSFIDYREDPARAVTHAQLVHYAREVLKSPSRHDVQIIRDACAALHAWGDADDSQRADAVLTALVNMPDPDPARLWPEEIGAVLCFCAATYIGLLVFMGMGMVP